MLCDFHTHTFLSDGSLSPLELIRRAWASGYRVIAITDHVGPGSMPRVIAEIKQDCALAKAHWDIEAIAGVELTHLPPAAIPETARQAKNLGASIVVVHGETPSEPVAPGTNLAAVKCQFVDILAHPGHLTADEALLAAQNGVFLEITTRASHRATNPVVADIALHTGARILVNSDAHEPEDLLTPETVTATARAAGIDDRLLKCILETNPALLTERSRTPRT